MILVHIYDKDFQIKIQIFKSIDHIYLTVKNEIFW